MLEFKKTKELETELIKYKNLCKFFSLIRAINAITTIIFIICFISLKEYLLYGIISLVLVILFIIAVILSQPFYQRVAILEHKKKVYEKHKQRRKKDFSHFADQGTEFKNKTDYKLSDLDIFGNRSLYQYLCEAKTPLGRKLLAKQLSNPDELDSKFKELTYDLASNEEALELEAILVEFKNKSNAYSTDEFTSAVGSKLKFKWTYILPLITFLGMIVYISIMVPLGLNYYVPLAFVGANLVLTKVLIKDEILTKNANAYYYLSDLYYELARGICDSKIANPYFLELRNNIKNELPLLKRIRSVYGILKLRNNIIINIILNMFVSIDSFVMIVLKAKIKDGIILQKSLDSIALIELALSFKNIGMDNEIYSIPEESEVIEAIDVIHPFVKNCVPNSITLYGGILLTGSNMSGKTTFMRTIGVCTLLKNAGSIVPAKSYKAPNLTICTSLRANDMLQEGVSTFYAEIERMKKINNSIKEGKTLILVDEIFKGTNAMERINASKEVMKKLNAFNALFIVSTHDFELCETEGITNYHFEEFYDGEAISFDFKLKNGPCTKGNALYLLKMSGILDE